MVEFAGWEMPIQYKGLREEHTCVRSAVGLFDVSHMGEIRFRGPKALQSLEWLTTNDVSRLNPGEAQYNLLRGFCYAERWLASSSGHFAAFEKRRAGLANFESDGVS